MAQGLGTYRRWGLGLLGQWVLRWVRSQPMEQRTSAMINRQVNSEGEIGSGHLGYGGPLPSQTGTMVPAWWSVIERHSRLLVAVFDLRTHQIEWTSDRFRQLVGMTDEPPTLDDRVLTRLAAADQQWMRERVRRHVLHGILTQQYDHNGLLPSRWLHEPLIVSVCELGNDRHRYVEFTVSSDRIRIESLAPEVREALAACWPTCPTTGEVMQALHTPDSALQRVVQQLTPETYTASGTVLIEGTDVTDREVAQRLTALLLDRESILHPQRFHDANRLMKRLFRATDSLIVTAEQDAAKLFIDLDEPEWKVQAHPVQALQASPMFQAACRGEVLNLPDLSCLSLTPCESVLRDRGARSLLMLPLVVKSARLKDSARLMGFMALASDRPDDFDIIDERNATALVPALTIAMRNTTHDRFTNIHESVRWRFEEEAERRSLGLPPEPIVFSNVYPLYGISDIRGSSSERNRAIQSDLLAQFDLARAILAAVCDAKGHAFIQQLYLDVIEKIEQLQQGVTVDAEVTLLRYLRDDIEAHFDYFVGCSAAAEAAIAQYRAAQDPEHGCVYEARAAYDRTIHHINQSLRDTWMTWQKTMQTITPHYCDVEATDGIDHMIYTGQSIDANFTAFHLRSLRYDQLRAVCDCARTAFRLKAQHDTEMDITHLILVQDSTVDITHDENTERLFDVRGTRDTRYEIVKKRIDKAMDARTQARITQPGSLTLVYSTNEEWAEYQEYLRYLQREGWIGDTVEQGAVEPLQGVTGLKFARVPVLPEGTP
ncbi:MAG: GAF domain-containing protein [Leptolyngbyaceae cyanobacterium T60_A2020_046]|nr:GAF domain-containing protein [Leptolyngbyaceae cyanobacterium T60_A2020_046]